MSEQRIDADGTWEQTSRLGWALIEPSAAWLAKRAAIILPADPRVALRAELRSAATIADMKAVLEKVIG